MPSHDQEDLRQELLVDLILRLKWFDPDRGTLRVFVRVILRHQVKRLANRVHRERNLFGVVSPEDVTQPSPGGAGWHETIDGADVHTPVFSKSEGITVIEQRLDLVRALRRLDPPELSLCTKLVELTPTEIGRTGEISRAGLYRRLKHIRLRLLEEGISCS